MYKNFKKLLNVLNTITHTKRINVTEPFCLQQNEEVVLLLRMLSLGLGAWQMIDSQQFKETKLVRYNILFCPKSDTIRK